MDLDHPLLALAADEPPPFPPSFPQLRRMDRSVVCQICKDFFHGPVSVECGHSFCSQCIRASLDVMKVKKCPACDVVVSEGSIRRNRALEEIMDSWEEARQMLLILVQSSPSGPSRNRPLSVPNSKASSSGSGSHPLKRQRRSSGKGSESPSKDGDPNAASEEELAFEELEPTQYVNREGFPDELGENDEGVCPLCAAQMSIASIPMHVERGCPPPKTTKTNMAGNQKADWKKVFAGAGMAKEKDVEMKRILKPNYAMATPSDLRALLSQYGLSTSGDRPVLESRVQEWIVLFNSNLDTSHPRSQSALRAKLSEAESSRKRDKEKGRDEMIYQMGTKDGMANYVKDSKGQFERLRREIMERDKRRTGAGVETPIEVD